MRIIHRDKEQVKLAVQSMDDLWYLSQIAEPGDIASGRTERKVKLGSGPDGKSASVKKTFFISLLIEKIEFHKYSNNLRISGKVTQGPEDVPSGSYHTFDVEEGTIITITKGIWQRYHWDRLKEASKPAQPKVLVVIFDREEVYFSLLRSYGYDLLSDFKGDIEKKDVPEKAKGNFYGDIAKQIGEYDARYSFSRIVLASPAFWKEYLLKELPDAIRKKTVLASCNSVGQNAINEVLSRPEVQTALKDDRVIREVAAIDELFAEINRSGLAAYGFKDTDNAVNMGAARVLLITDSAIRKSREEGSYGKLEHMMRTAESTKSDILIVSSDHDGGKRLDGLGGIGAVLRYRL
jgi:protein pelota